MSYSMGEIIRRERERNRVNSVNADFTSVELKSKELGEHMASPEAELGDVVGSSNLHSLCIGW